ncbi:S-adenosylmethionine decarboxylase [Candidatus Azambacteria bacterium]|nr:S-adenosylmethionine decarboxylase [Candidatus Azambacteria bacterium]MBI3685475.1 S-adenosylmethionine decarboxylase [Candidatus Azambacteria bacterium]
MKNIEPAIHRQRLVIEARYTQEITREMVKQYLLDLAKELKMTIHPDLPQPLITSATGKSKPIHDGYEGIILWVESGAAIYVWERFHFLTVDIYTCAAFNSKKAIDFTARFFKTSELEYKEV